MQKGNYPIVYRLGCIEFALACLSPCPLIGTEEDIQLCHQHNYHRSKRGSAPVSTSLRSQVFDIHLHMRLFTTNPALLYRTYTINSSHRRPLPLSLPAFLLRAQVLSLYRTILRTTRLLAKSDPTRNELKKFARSEFERNRNVQQDDLSQVKSLVAAGRAEVERWRGLIGGVVGGWRR